MPKGLKRWWEKWSKKNQAHPDLKQRLNFIFSLDGIIRSVHHSLDAKDSFATLAGKLREHLAFDYLISFGWENKNRILELEQSFPEKLPGGLKKGSQVKPNSEQVLQVLQNQERLSKFVTPTLDSFCGFEKLMAQLKIASAMIFPLFCDSQNTGLFLVGRTNPQNFTDYELELVEAIVPHWALARENARLYEETKRADQSQASPKEQIKPTEELKKMKEVTSKTVHDFNNHLATILGRTEILQMKIGKSNFPEKENLLKSLSVIEKTVGQGTQLLTTLSQLYRPKPELRELDLKELLEETVQTIKFQFPEKLSAKTVELQLDGKLSEPDQILADPREVKEAFTDLILSTISYLPSPAKLQMVISEEEKQVAVQFRVQEKLRGNITKEKIAGELSLSQSILSQNKGELTWDETGEAGFLMSVSFPRIHPAPKKTEVMAAAPVHSSSGQILLFEEQQSLGDILQEYLQFLGYQVKKFKNPKLALEVFNTDKFDLVFTDVGRAGMFGWNFIEQIKKSNPEVPVVLIAAKGISFNTAELVKQGIGGVIYKPFDFAGIKQTVNDILEKTKISVKI